MANAGKQQAVGVPEGPVSCSEFTYILQTLDPFFTSSRAQRLFSLVDKDNSGSVDFADVIKYLSGRSGDAPKRFSSKEAAWSDLEDVIHKLWGEEKTETVIALLKEVVSEHDQICKEEGIAKGTSEAVSSMDATLITYANTVVDTSGEMKPMTALAKFVEYYEVCESMKCVHMLPMFPWDTDRGFSVMDYYKVEPSYGDWSDVTQLGSEACGSPTIMFDYVCNHASIDNPWVQNGLIARHIRRDHPSYAQVMKYKDFVIVYALDDGPAEDQKPPDEVIARLTRPRKFPVLCKYFVTESRGGELLAHVGVPEIDGPERLGRDFAKKHTVIGAGYTWATFSRGTNEQGIEQTRQIDLNYRNPKVLAEVVRVLLFYVRKGSRIIRLDAIGYIWKVLGSNSIHERGTHMLLAIVYRVLKIADPAVMTVAEVNEPVAKVQPYLGSKELPESNMVYNFAPFPMAMHAQILKDTTFFANFLTSMDSFEGDQFITVLGSHDGLAQKQVREILPPEELERLQQAFIRDRGGLCNMARVAGGKEIVYEVCGTPWCLVNGTHETCKDSLQVQLSRYLCCLCLGLLPRGMPGIYFQGLVGAYNYKPPGGLDEYRTMNRESFDVAKLSALLDDSRTRESMVYTAVQDVMRARSKLLQFDRKAPPPKVLDSLNVAVLAVVLEAPEGSGTSPLLALVNVANQKRKAAIRGLPAALTDCKLRDALDGVCGILRNANPEVRSKASMKKQDTAGLDRFDAELELEMAPYEVIWLIKQDANCPKKNFSAGRRSVLAHRGNHTAC